jgi:hypothetical protein
MEDASGPLEGLMEALKSEDLKSCLGNIGEEEAVKK